jgi:MFS family permease
MKSTSLVTPVLIAGCIIVMLSFAVRASFGIFQIPVAEEFGWLRTEFSMAIAIQNLFWGIGQPIFGAIAEKVTDRKAITLGGLVYALGLILSSYAVTPGAMQAYGILVGFGIAGTGFGVILAVVGRAASDEHRSMALAIATAAGLSRTGDRRAFGRISAGFHVVAACFHHLRGCYHRLADLLADDEDRARGQ